jgi:hypothetical protein
MVEGHVPQGVRVQVPPSALPVERRGFVYLSVRDTVELSAFKLYSKYFRNTRNKRL